MVATYGSRAGRRRRRRSLDPMDFRMLKLIYFHGVALLNDMPQHFLLNLFDFTGFTNLQS